MKKIISNLLIAAIITSLVPGNSTAQNQSGIFSSASGKTNSSDDGNAPNSNPVIDEKPGKQNIKALKANLKAARANFRSNADFSSKYKNATDVSWNTESEAIVVTFKVGELRSRSVYDRAGSWRYTVLNYYEDGLPNSITTMVKSAYKGLNISLVQEILEGDVRVYEIHLENDTTIKQVLVCNGEITEYKSFQKSK